jgi:hypothetical protein
MWQELGRATALIVWDEVMRISELRQDLHGINFARIKFTELFGV